MDAQSDIPRFMDKRSVNGNNTTMSESHCPFCNGVLPPLATRPASEKRPCPRCGEPIAAARWPIDAAAAAFKAGEPPLPAAPNTRAANRTTGLMMLGIMVSMAFIGLGYMLWTTQIRRARDPKKVEKLEPISARRPLELSGLGYLPRDCQVIAGLHIVEMLNDKQGQALLAAPRPFLLDLCAKQITRTTGLKLEDLDHIVLAVVLDAPKANAIDPVAIFPMQLAMIVKTRPKVSLEKIADARPRRSTLHQDRPLYEFSLEPLGEAMLWCVEDQTLIYVARLDAPKLEHLRALSATPRKIDEAAPAVLAKAMQERLPTHPYVWAVGRVDQLGAAKEFLPFLALGAKADLGPLKELQTFAVSLEPVEGLTLKGDFQLPSAKSAAAFKKLLERAQIDGAKSQKVEAAPPDEPEQWVTWQVRSDVPAMRDLLNRGKEAKKK
jgi:hypothetical protein